jgi:transmembrane sensor
MNNLMIQELLDRYLSGDCSAEEQLIVEKWLEQQEGGDNRWLEMDASAKEAWMTLLYRDVQHTIKSNAAPVVPLYRRPFFRMAVAAVLILIIGAGALWFIPGSSHGLAKTADTALHQNDVLPGGNKAVLTLANGSAIILDSAANGELAKQGNTTILKTAGGQLAYNILNEKPAEVLYNTLATPRGGQYQLVLPDGSKVWLNAASSIRYPVAFTGGDRNVEITGEAYFEIAKDKAKPFHVKAYGMKVEVLGTHFNVNAYPDEPGIRTTLLEGSVKIVMARQTQGGQPAQQGQQELILLPGQQARVERNITLVKAADLDQVMAWKNGLFNFNDADLQTVLRQLARWYDIDVKFEGSGPARSFHGKITRDLNLSQVIRVLQAVEVKFRIEGRTLIVTQ